MNFDDEPRRSPKSIHSLMLKDSEYSMILHSEYPRSEEQLINLLDGLDFVVQRWLESMLAVLHEDEHEDITDLASQVLMSVMTCRYVIIDFMGNESSVTDFMDVLRAIKDLKQEFVCIAKPYHNIGHLFNWYLDLPLKVQFSFKHLHMMRMNHNRHQEPKHDGAIYK